MIDDMMEKADFTISVDVKNVSPRLLKELKKEYVLISSLGVTCFVRGMNANLKFSFIVKRKKMCIKFPTNLPYLMNNKWNGVDGLVEKAVRGVRVYLKKKNLYQTRTAEDFLRGMVKYHLLAIREKIKEII